MNPADASDRIVKEIVINAPAQRVFDAIADPLQRVKWWGADGRFRATHMESELRPGGRWLMSGTRDAGNSFTVRGEYREVDRPRALEFTWLADWHGNASSTVVRFDLEERDGATTVRLTHSGFTSGETRDTYRGWPWLLSLLQKYVETSSPG